MLTPAPSATVLAVLPALAGAVMTPAITVQFTVMDAVAPGETATEAFGWMNPMSGVGAGLGAAAGHLVAARAEPGFLPAAAMCAVAAALAASGQCRALGLLQCGDGLLDPVRRQDDTEPAVRFGQEMISADEHVPRVSDLVGEPVLLGKAAAVVGRAMGLPLRLQMSHHRAPFRG